MHVSQMLITAVYSHFSCYAHFFRYPKEIMESSLFLAVSGWTHGIFHLHCSLIIYLIFSRLLLMGTEAAAAEVLLMCAIQLKEEQVFCDPFLVSIDRFVETIPKTHLNSHINCAILDYSKFHFRSLAPLLRFAVRNNTLRSVSVKWMWHTHWETDRGRQWETSRLHTISIVLLTFV